MYTFWKENSIISVDRRNDRHYVKVSPHKLHRLTRDIDDYNVKKFTTEKGKEKLKGHKHIYTKSVKGLHEEFTLKTGDSISLSSFYLLKPFYVLAPSIHEMESCTCINCVNPHYLYKSYKKVTKKLTGKVLPNSLTDFLTQNFKCSMNNEFDYWNSECIKGTCKNKCKIDLPPVETEDKKLHSYVKFKPTLTTYYNTEGKLVHYTRCARNVEQALLEEMHSMLQNEGKKYLEHRHFVSLDKAFWPKFQSECPVPILHLDYSENVKLTPKNEVQSAHFSGRQHTLHCCVHYKTNTAKDHEFIYHLSDDTTHDAVMTFAVLEDLLEKCPNIVQSGTLVIRSDNSSTQYKSRYTFAAMVQLAIKYDIDIFWIYGAPGHGRGLVDAMSSFGCKGPLRKSIITSEDELFFTNANEMKTFLSDYFAEDATKKYFLVDEQKNAEKRQIKKEDRPQNPIRGSSKLHLVAVSPNSEWLTKSYLSVNDEDIMNLRIDGDDIAEVDDVDDDTEEDMEEDPQVIIERVRFNNIKFDFLAIGTYVALYSGGWEQFYLVEVLDKGTADSTMKDDHQHVIPAGHNYMLGCYFEKDKEKRDHVLYKKCKKFSNVLINMSEIASVNVEFDGVRMSKEEYVATCREVLSS